MSITNKLNKNLLMEKFFLLIMVLPIAFFFSQALAVEKPRSLSTDSRIKVVTYQQDNVVPIEGETFITTQVIFGENEKIIDVQGGDAAAWTIYINNALSNVLNLKPTILGSHTDLSVTTIDDNDKRRYYRFELSSNQKSDNKSEIYAIQFIYPEEEKTKVISQVDYLQSEKRNILKAYKNPELYNWDYSFNGPRSILPLHVFDDSRFTYMQLLPNQTNFAVFAVDNRAGSESVVNYRRVGDYLVIEKVSPQFTLRAGKYAVASIFNNRIINAWKK